MSDVYEIVRNRGVEEDLCKAVLQDLSENLTHLLNNKEVEVITPGLLMVAMEEMVGELVVMRKRIQAHLLVDRQGAAKKEADNFPEVVRKIMVISALSLITTTAVSLAGGDQTRINNDS